MRRDKLISWSFPERMAGHQQRMRSRLDALQKFNTALDPFYASLNAEQAKTADEILPMR